MEKEELKQKLKAAWVLRMKIDELRDQLYELHTTGTRITPNYDLVPASCGDNIGKTERAALAIYELERELYATIERECAEVRETNSIIDMLDDELLKTVMIKRYIRHKPWERIALELGYSWAQLHRIHSKALNEILKSKNK